MKILTSWPVPVFMLALFATLISTSNASTAGILAALFGLALVLILWSVFREFSAHAEITRALSIGDGETAAKLAEVQLGRRRRTRSKAPFRIYLAMAHELRGQWDAIEPMLLAAHTETMRGGAGAGSWQQVAACLRVGARCETGHVAQARALFDKAIAPRIAVVGDSTSIFAAVTEGRLLYAEGEIERAEARLQPLIRNIRLSPSQRAIALHYLARCAQAAGRRSDAEQFHKQAAALAPASWFAVAGAAVGLDPVGAHRP
jgi:tetratricopeptide (TPR) repeat protein